MRVLLVTSQVTYIPGNYIELFEEVIQRCRKHICGLLILKNLDMGLLKTTAGLFYLGAKGVGKSLVKNIATLPQKSRENLFAENGLPVYTSDNINSEATIEMLKELDLDLIINLRTRSIYKLPVLSVPKIGCINIHHGILPNFRGTLCDLYALSEGRPAGFSIHQMNEKIDDGVILKTHEVDDGREKNYMKYLAKTSRVEGQVLSEVIEQIATLGKLPDGIKNTPTNKVYTRNPNRQKIKTFLQQEMVL